MLIIPFFFKNSRLGYFLTQITPHPSPLPASGERGLDGLIFVINKKSERKLDRFFYSNTKYWRVFNYAYFLKKIVAVIPSPHLWGEG